jgi:hypothetical protein
MEPVYSKEVVLLLSEACREGSKPQARLVARKRSGRSFKYVVFIAATEVDCIKLTLYETRDAAVPCNEESPMYATRP